ncbi:MAG: hypothetical protein EAX81_05965 [Candidatus Thorarchaeota archaeon]|nr:hypothetical protein [Candidatus Thorarchaeota archaeon]
MVMKKLEVDGPVMMLRNTHELISHKKAILTLERGCIFVYLKHDGNRVGIAFDGPSQLVVDAIAETEYGAVGESVKPCLKGIQLYLGVTRLENKSESASENDARALGYGSNDAFVKASMNKIQDQVNGDHRTSIETGKGSILLGKDSDEKSIILVAKDDKELVFIHGKNVFAVGDDNIVSVDKSGVRIRGKHGRDIAVTKDGIVGLEGLAEIGPAIGRAVGEAMRGLSSLGSWTSLKSVKNAQYAYDNVDDFDWDD